MKRSVKYIIADPANGLAALIPHFPWNSTLNPQRCALSPAVADLVDSLARLVQPAVL